MTLTMTELLSNYPYPDEKLRGQYPPKVILRKMEKAVSKGFINYGVSMRSGWLTDKGRAFLETAETTRSEKQSL